MGSRFLAEVYFHPVVAAAYVAYSRHHALVLSPDIIWLMVLQGFANHVNVNPQKLRDRLVDHSGQVRISVRRDDLVKGSQDNPWPDVVDGLVQQIRDHVGDTTCDLLLPEFSTTGQTERVAAQMVLHGAVLSYFEYEVRTICGIPVVVLEGTTADWKGLDYRVLPVSEGLYDRSGNGARQLNTRQRRSDQRDAVSGHGAGADGRHHYGSATVRAGANAVRVGLPGELIRHGASRRIRWSHPGCRDWGAATGDRVGSPRAAGRVTDEPPVASRYRPVVPKRPRAVMLAGAPGPGLETDD